MIHKYYLLLLLLLLLTDHQVFPDFFVWWLANCKIIIILLYIYVYISLQGGSVVKNLPAMQETQVRSLGWEDPSEKEMAIHSGILAWETPWTEEPGQLQSMQLQKSQTNLSD